MGESLEAQLLQVYGVLVAATSLLAPRHGGSGSGDSTDVLPTPALLATTINLAVRARANTHARAHPNSAPPARRTPPAAPIVQATRMSQPAEAEATAVGTALRPLLDLMRSYYVEVLPTTRVASGGAFATVTSTLTWLQFLHFFVVYDTVFGTLETCWLLSCLMPTTCLLAAGGSRGSGGPAPTVDSQLGDVMVAYAAQLASGAAPPPSDAAAAAAAAAPWTAACFALPPATSPRMDDAGDGTLNAAELVLLADRAALIASGVLVDAHESITGPGSRTTWITRRQPTPWRAGRNARWFKHWDAARNAIVHAMVAGVPTPVARWYAGPASLHALAPVLPPSILRLPPIVGASAEA